MWKRQRAWPLRQLKKLSKKPKRTKAEDIVVDVDALADRVIVLAFDSTGEEDIEEI